MIFPIPGVAGNDAASRCHQIRFFHSAVCRSSPGISGTGIFVSRGLPSVMASDRYDVRLQPHRRDRIRGRSVVSGSHCDEQPCIPCFCNPGKQLLLERSFPDRADPDGNIQNSRMINPACVQHIPDAFYHGGNVSVPTFVQHLAYYQTAAWRNSGIQTVGTFPVSTQAACHMGCFCPPTKSANPAILPERSGCSAIPVSSTAAVTPFPESPFTSAAVAWTTLFTLFKAYASFFF